MPRISRYPFVPLLLVLTAGPLAAEDYWLAAAAHTPGFEGTQWQTDVMALNLCQDDAVVELMRDSRGLAGSRNELRELWYNGLEQPNKEEIVFELEMLLKGVVCFGSLANHTGPRKREPEESRQYNHELRVIQMAFERVAELSEQLCIRGWVGARCLLNVKGSMILADVLPVDSRYMCWERDVNGLAMVSWQAEWTKEEYEAKYNEALGSDKATLERWFKYTSLTDWR